MAFLRIQDYYKVIQDTQLEQITAADDNQRLYSEQLALAKLKSYLVQKYDLTTEFKDIKTFSITDTYKAGQTVQLDASAYGGTTTYAKDQIVLASGIVYYSLQNSNTGNTPASSPAWWKVLGNQYDLFYIPSPYTQFNYKDLYSLGQYIIWNDYAYKCLIPTNPPGHEVTLQYLQLDKVPNYNVFPDNQIADLQQWGSKTAYSITGLWPNAVPGDFSVWSSATTYTTGQRITYNSVIYKALANSLNVNPGTDLTKWQPESYAPGDARNQQLIDALVVMTIYYLHRRIAPRNIPQLRVDDYNNTILWLEQAAKGEVTLDVPKLQPLQGSRIRFGGNIKSQNTL